MSDSNPIEDLFQEEDAKKQDVVAIINHLGQYGFQALGYGAEIGPNPGYIFRGELDYEIPLQTSLERLLKKAQSVLPRETELTESFIEGEGGRVATLIDQLNQNQHSHHKDDVFWWLSLMGHYRKPTRSLDFTRDIRLALFFPPRIAKIAARMNPKVGLRVFDRTTSSSIVCRANTLMTHTATKLRLSGVNPAAAPT
jgi:hypothetical protein